MEERYFAASNSCKGFLSYFGEIFSAKKLKRLYIIKGGPGTGKNMFMKEVAKAAEERGSTVVRFYCSSDQHSLDGILIDNKIAVVDGTAPHTVECVFPGAVDNIIDLGAFWDSGGLSGSREIIERLNKEKSSHYRRAYRYLSSYHQLSEAVSELVTPLIDKKSLENDARLALCDEKEGSGYSENIIITDSVGMDGRVYFDTLSHNAKKVILISDDYLSAYIYLAKIAQICAEKKLSVTLSYDPVESDRIDAVLLNGSGLLFTSKLGEETDASAIISMKNYIDLRGIDSLKEKIQKALKLRELMMDEALFTMDDIKRVHFIIEDIYKSKMNFEAKEKFTREFIEKMFPNL